MKDNPGCLLFGIDVCLLLYAIFSLLCGEAGLFSWSILLGAAFALFWRVVDRWINKRIEREKYKRKGSYWSQKAKEDKEAKEAKEGEKP